jgi:hypothetical protein
MRSLLGKIHEEAHVDCFEPAARDALQGPEGLIWLNCWFTHLANVPAS